MKNLKNVSTRLIQQIMIVAVTIGFVSFGMITEVKAQALEKPTWGKYIMIGKNDQNLLDNHFLTLGGGYPNNNLGLWMLGIYDSGFCIRRAPNMLNGSQTQGTSALFIDSNGYVGIDYGYWNTLEEKLDVNGFVRSWGNMVISDRRYKRNIKPISSLDNLFNLNSVQYQTSGEAYREQLELFKQNRKNTMTEEDFNLVVSAFEKQIAERDTNTTIRFGFIAQELREMYPNLVNEDSKGFLSVNYTELIPVLVDAVKELNSRIEKLEGKNKETMPTNFSSAVLYQNNPNPFTASTEIRYYIPENTLNAVICIYDMVGSQIMKIDNLSRGYSSVRLDGSRLKAGMYMYSLLVDGKEIDTKRMILTDK